jgi:RNA-directed DNA polymerase
MFSKISSFENLLNSYYLARRGNSDKNMALDFSFNLEGYISKLSWELKSGRYIPMPYKYFVVHEPKTRNIAAPHFRDRVVQHSLVSMIEPVFEKKLIFDCYACRVDKGTHFAAKRVRKFLQAARSTKGRNSQIYILQCDIKKFFPSVSWQVLLEIIKKTVTDPKTFDLIKKIVTIHRAFCGKAIKLDPDVAIVSTKDKRGLPIGNLTSQIFANVYLNELDHFVKESLREKWYGRYMDDFFVISESKDHLRAVREEVRSFLREKLDLSLHPQKVNIQNVNQGVSFVGYRIFFDHVLIRGKTLLRMQKRLKLKTLKLKKGKIKEEELHATVNSLKGHLQHANSWRLSKVLFRAI